MVTGMSERTKEALVPSIKNGRALLKSLGGMQISGMSLSESPARDSSPAPESGTAGAQAENPSWPYELIVGGIHLAHAMLLKLATAQKTTTSACQSVQLCLQKLA